MPAPVTEAGTFHLVLSGSVMHDLCPGAFAVPLLSSEECVELLADIDRRRSERADRSLGPPSSMHDHGVILADIGLGDWVDALLAERIRPLAAELLPEHHGATLDHHHAYLVEYSAQHDEDLGFHVDDSEVTLNLCLGEEPFSGAELVLLGRRCAAHRQTPVDPGERLEIEHEVGTAILHAGAHRHQVEPIRRGVRRNLIVWCRSSTARVAPDEGCPAWCPVPG